MPETLVASLPFFFHTIYARKYLRDHHKNSYLFMLPEHKSHLAIFIKSVFTSKTDLPTNLAANYLSKKTKIIAKHSRNPHVLFVGSPGCLVT